MPQLRRDWKNSARNGDELEEAGVAYHRKCELGLCPPYREIFGTLYGVCPLIEECPPEITCGYSTARQEIQRVTEKTETR